MEYLVGSTPVRHIPGMISCGHRLVSLTLLQENQQATSTTAQPRDNYLTTPSGYCTQYVQNRCNMDGIRQLSSLYYISIVLQFAFIVEFVHRAQMVQRYNHLWRSTCNTNWRHSNDVLVTDDRLYSSTASQTTTAVKCVSTKWRQGLIYSAMSKTNDSHFQRRIVNYHFHF